MPRSFKNINAINLVLGLRGAQKRGGEQWITDEIKDYQSSVSRLNKAFCHLAKERVPSDPNLRMEILKLLAHHGPILWPVPDPSKSRDRYWLYKAPHSSASDEPDDPSYPKDLIFVQDHLKIEPYFVRLLELRLIGYISNHVLNAQTTGCTSGNTEPHLSFERVSSSDSELTEMTESEDRRESTRTSSLVIGGDYLSEHEMGGARSYDPDEVHHRKRRQVIPAMCARCRRLHIKCSGNPGDEPGCKACRNDGSLAVSQCKFDTVDARYPSGIDANGSNYLTSRGKRSLIVRLMVPSYKLRQLLVAPVLESNRHSLIASNDSSMNATRDTSLSTGRLSSINRLQGLIGETSPDRSQAIQLDPQRRSILIRQYDDLYHPTSIRSLSGLPQLGDNQAYAPQQRQSANFEFAPVGVQTVSSVAATNYQPVRPVTFSIKEEAEGDEVTYLGTNHISDFAFETRNHSRHSAANTGTPTNTTEPHAPIQTGWLASLAHATGNEELHQQTARSEDDATIEHRLARTTLKLRSDINNKRICTPNAFKGCNGAEEVHRALMGYIAECLSVEDHVELTVAATIKIVLFIRNGAEKKEDFTFKMALQADEFADGWIWLEEQLLEYTGSETFLLDGVVYKNGG